ncbi:hypothetical protein D4764_06G0006850 [Takifugu flavidus]|uniref:CTF/NF-I domain-containing protein n=1 Tax=Takifugu flavidus TaxID=433684 RepID=A0A5C6MWB3_9TELE|nr:hypothetical protein D4764_06G0006850 [Takifugu flavidus]
MIDFVVVSSDLWPHVLDTRVKRRAELSTDHHLAESPVRRSFKSHLRESFDRVPGEAGDIESKWTMFCASIIEAADQCCGHKVVGACHGSNARTCWWTPVPLDWQTGVVVPLFKKGDQRVWSNYRGITLLSLPGKVYSGVQERRVRQIVEPRIQEEQCGFRPGRGTVDQLYTLSRVFEDAWEFAQPVHMCFVDLEKAFDHVPRGGPAGGPPRVWGVGPADTGRPLPVRSVSELGPHCWQIGSLLFADDVVLLASSARDLQLSLDRFAAACEAAGMKISTSKSEAMVLNRKKVECLLRVKEEILPQVEEFKYLGVLFTSEGRMEQEINRP